MVWQTYCGIRVFAISKLLWVLKHATIAPKANLNRPTKKISSIHTNKKSYEGKHIPNLFLAVLLRVGPALGCDARRFQY